MQRLRQSARRDVEGGTYLHQTASPISRRSSNCYAESWTSRRNCEAKPPSFYREQINSQRICRVSGMHAVRYEELRRRGAHWAHQSTEMVMTFIFHLPIDLIVILDPGTSVHVQCTHSIQVLVPSSPLLMFTCPNNRHHFVYLNSCQASPISVPSLVE